MRTGPARAPPLVCSPAHITKVSSREYTTTAASYASRPSAADPRIKPAQESPSGGARRIGALAVAGGPLGRAQQVDALSASHDLDHGDSRRAGSPPRESKEEVAD